MWPIGSQSAMLCNIKIPSCMPLVSRNNCWSMISKVNGTITEPNCRAKKELDTSIEQVLTFDDFCKNLDKKKLLLAPFCGGIPCEDKIKTLSARCVSTSKLTVAASLINPWEVFAIACSVLGSAKFELPDEIRCVYFVSRDAVVEEGAPAMGAKGLCIPFNQPQDITPDMKCICPECNDKPQFFTLFGRSY